MTTFSVTALLTATGAAKFLKRGLELAGLAKLPVTSWRTGDPTLSDYTFIADVLGNTIEPIVIRNAKSAFISTAEGDWKRLHAQDNFGVDVPEATYAQPTITLQNNGVNFYPLESGDLTVRASAINKTYRNASPGYDPVTLLPADLNPGSTVKFDLIADEAGSDSSVGAGEVDRIVTISDPDVVILSSESGAATDAPDDTEIEALCEDSLGPLSPNGPADAYAFVARSAKYTGTTEITRSTASLESETGDVAIAVASPSGPVTPTSVALAQTAVEKWANPICAIPQVVSSAALAVDVVAVFGGDLPSDFAAKAKGAVVRYFKGVPIGGLVARSKLFEVMHEAVPEAKTIALGSPATDVQLSTLPTPQVPVLGIGTFTEA